MAGGSVASEKISLASKRNLLEFVGVSGVFKLSSSSLVTARR